MPIRLSNLWRWTGTVDRAPYFLIGVALVALKFGLDWLVAGLVSIARGRWRITWRRRPRRSGSLI